ncbi:O-antigen ligase family protein [Arenimonas fontis]|uniref:O-antigen ligase family protein n=1 Tax=Arenimonas fontis TaxID=2608255 RepID=A0A5B2ZA14_9GAMM|nr:O-antigen ligase family protein [Arenimonas fontis]KAA2284363.1 O-antigen ligase family protein [Arenimonas fontis]
MTNSSPTETRLQWAPWWVLGFVALWPLPGPAEAVLSLGAVVALAVLAVHRFRGGIRLLSHEAWALTTVLFMSYWLPELISSLDAYDRPRALREALLDLRYLPFLWLVAIAVAGERGRRLTFAGLAVIASLWLLDGLVQALTGFSLGGPMSADRLSGIFGADNLKLGLVLASLAPFPLEWSARRLGLAGWVLMAAGLVVVVLLAGARAAWVTLGLVLAVSAWMQFGSRRALLLLGAGALAVATLLYACSDTLQERLQRTEAMLEGNAESLDHALSGRLPIWSTAWRMALAHPVNGVGVRGFRNAYADYADPDDPWLADRDHGAGYHAHQIVLEVLSETGFLGLFFWLGGVAIAWRAWRFAPPEARARACPPALALVATLFPLNTHLAFYSTFWGGLTLLLAALYAGSLLAGDGALARTGDDGQG